MKKICFALAAVMALSAAASAEVGIGVKGGLYSQSDNLGGTFGMIGNTKYSNDKYFGGLEFIFQDYFTESNMLGFKIGAELRAPLKMDNMMNMSLKNDLYTFPLTLYYKYAPPCAFINFWLGGGVSLGLSKWTFDAPIMDFSTSQNSLVVFPHLNAGIEFRPTEHIGLGIDGAYNFSAKTAEDFGLGGANYTRDISGFEANLALRFYF